MFESKPGRNGSTKFYTECKDSGRLNKLLVLFITGACAIEFSWVAVFWTANLLNTSHANNFFSLCGGFVVSEA